MWLEVTTHHSETTPGAEGTAIGSDWPQLLRIKHASVEGGHQSWNTLGPGIIFTSSFQELCGMGLKVSTHQQTSKAPYPSFACRTPWHGGTCRRDMLSWCVPRTVPQTVPRTPSLRAHGRQLPQQPRRDRDRPGRCYQRRRWRQWNFQKQSWDLSTVRLRKDGGCWKYDVPICSADHRSDHSRIFKATMFNGINGYSNGWFPNHPKSWSLGDRIGFLSQELVFVQPNCNDN